MAWPIRVLQRDGLLWAAGGQLQMGRDRRRLLERARRVGQITETCAFP